MVRIDAIEVQNATLSGIEALLTLDVENPNTRNVVADGFDYAIDVGGVELLTGRDSRSFTIGAQEHQKIMLPVFLAYSDLLEVVPRVLQTGKLDYVAQGTVFVGSYSVPFKKIGNMQLPNMQLQRN